MKILSFGSLNIDYVYQVDEFLLPGETKSSKDLQVYCGGKGLNQSIAAAKAGNQVYHAGWIGSDGKMLKTKLEEWGVNTSLIYTTPEKNGHAVIQVDDAGQNCILLYGGTNQKLTEPYIDEVLTGFSEQDIVLLQNETNLVDLIIRKASAKGMRVAFNAAPMKDQVLSYPLELLSWLIINEVEGRQLTGAEKEAEILAALQAKYPSCTILLTLGGQGACCLEPDGSLHRVGTYPVEVTDTTAAGDTFIGYFLNGILRNKPMEEVLHFATAASALCIKKAGAADSIPVWEKVEAAVASQALGELKSWKSVFSSRKGGLFFEKEQPVKQ